MGQYVRNRPKLFNMTLPSGTMLGRYRIESGLGEGKYGVVYQGFDTAIERPVAIKCLRPPEGEPESQNSQPGVPFEEAKVIGQLNHPHIAAVFDMGTSGDVVYIVMEFVQGETLKDRVLAGSLAIGEACAIACQLLLGLGAIHSAGVLHLDFKSQNVMLRSGIEPAQAVVMDFSLSRAFDKELLLKTNERHLAGSIGYMSPEQLECQATLGPSSDVYAFGVVLFEMLTGHLPFEGENPASIMLKQLKRRPPAPSSLRPGISAALDSFVLTCLSRQPRGRFQGVDAALCELRQCLASGSTRPRTASRRRHVGLIAGVTAVCGLLASASRSVQPPRLLQRAELGLHTGEPPPAPPARTALVHEQAVLEAPTLAPSPSRLGSAKPLHFDAGSNAAAVTKPVRRRSAPRAAREPALDDTAAPSAAAPNTAAPNTASASAAPPNAVTAEQPALPGPAAPARAPAWTPQHAPDFLL